MAHIIKNIWRWIENVLYKITYKLLTLFHVRITEEAWDTFMQFIKFGLVGISNTAISYVTYLIVCLLGFSFHTGNILGFIVSVLNSFYWNNKYVFTVHENERRTWWKALFKTFISYAFSGLILTEILLTLWIEIFHISQLIAPLINLLVTIPINFIMNKLWAYKSSLPTKRKE